MIEVDWLYKWNQYSPRKVAVKDIASGKEITYSELYQQSLKLAEMFSNRFAVKVGDRVAFLGTNKVEFIAAFYALQRLQAIMVPINFRFTGREIQHVLDDSGASLLVYQKYFGETLSKVNTPTTLSFEDMAQELSDLQCNSELRFEAPLESPVMILYTSGTTGFPKGAIITHKMLYWNSVNTGLRLNLTSEDVSLCFLPLFHTGGWNVLTTPMLHRGATLLFLETFDADKIVELCDSDGVTILFGVPTTMDLMARSRKFADATFNSIRYAIVGGEPMSIELIKTWDAKGVPVRQGYGLTEFGPNVFSLNEEDAIRKIGSIGFANFYIETKVVDAEGRECLPGEIGELLLRGPMCMAGYWNNDEATAETIVDGWLHTGDLVRFDEEGYFYVVGRKKDMFISGGENVYPVEVEQVLSAHPSVREVAVIGVPDDKWGEVGKAFVSLEQGFEYDEESLAGYCQENLAKFKVPKYFNVLAELPKGDSGKILKRQLQ